MEFPLPGVFLPFMHVDNSSLLILNQNFHLICETFSDSILLLPATQVFLVLRRQPGRLEGEQGKTN